MHARAQYHVAAIATIATVGPTARDKLSARWNETQPLPPLPPRNTSSISSRNMRLRIRGCRENGTRTAPERSADRNGRQETVRPAPGSEIDRSSFAHPPRARACEGTREIAPDRLRHNPALCGRLARPPAPADSYRIGGLARLRSYAEAGADTPRCLRRLKGHGARGHDPRHRAGRPRDRRSSARP